MSETQSPNLTQELVNAEQTRNLCGNLLRFLKESTVRGSEAYQVAQSIDFIQFIFQQNDRAVKDIKKRLSRGEETAAPTAPVAIEAAPETAPEAPKAESATAA